MKRLFLFFAERHRHAQQFRLNMSRIDLGSCKRVLIKGGKLDSRYDSPVVPAPHAHSTIRLLDYTCPQARIRPTVTRL